MGDSRNRTAPFNLQEVARSAGGFLQRIDETAKKLNDAIADVRKYVFNEHTLTNLSAAVVNMRVVSEHALIAVDNVNSVVATNTTSIAAAVSNLVYFSEQLNDFAGALNGVVSTNGAQLTSAMKNIESSTMVLKNVLNDVEWARVWQALWCGMRIWQQTFPRSPAT